MNIGTEKIQDSKGCLGIVLVSGKGRDSGGPARGLSRRKTGVRGAEWGRWIFRHRGFIFAPLGGILFLQALVSYWQAVGKPTGPRGWVAWLVALGLIALGLSVRVHVAGRARPGTSSRGSTFEASQLITTGMYAYVRNPLYLANVMIWTALALLVGPAWWAALLTLVAGCFYHLIVLAEEEFLTDRFPHQYPLYCSRVPRWLPSFARWIASGEQVRLVGMGKFALSNLPLAKEKLPETQCLPQSSEGIESSVDWPIPPWLEGVWKKSVRGINSSGVRILSQHSLPQGAQEDPLAHEDSGHIRLAGPPEAAALKDPNCPEDAAFSWRRALFREADTLMLVGFAVWSFTGLASGWLPWQWPSGIFRRVLGLGMVASLGGWGWIKWLKKRSWPRRASSAKLTAPAGPSYGCSSFQPSFSAPPAERALTHQFRMLKVARQ